jgi:anti-sigma regulatory factor (Ser/Thr protein kinase)
MSQRFQITRCAELESLQEFRAFITECCSRYDIANDTVLDLKLAVDEACTNIVTHGYQGMDPGSVILSFWIEPERILVQITDFGHAFEPVETPMPDVEAALEDEDMGGLGLYLIYQTMDNIDYQSSAEGNTLTFTKFLV